MAAEPPSSPALEPLDAEALDRDLWGILRSIVEGVGGAWMNSLGFIPAVNESYEIGARTKADYRSLFSTLRAAQYSKTPELSN
jgi:hypothetical protein